MCRAQTSRAGCRPRGTESVRGAGEAQGRQKGPVGERTLGGWEPPFPPPGATLHRVFANGEGSRRACLVKQEGE